MENEAFFFMMVFGMVTLVCAFFLYRNQNPKESVFFYRYPAIKKMSQEDALKTAKKTAKGVALMGVTTMIGAVAGIWNTTVGAVILILGNCVMLFVISKLLKD